MAADDKNSDGGESDKKSTRITFRNPEASDVSTESERHQQEYFEAVKFIRNRLRGDINIFFGEFAAAVKEAEESDNFDPFSAFLEQFTGIENIDLESMETAQKFDRETEYIMERREELIGELEKLELFAGNAADMLEEPDTEALDSLVPDDE